MKTWTRLGIGFAALALAVALGTAAYAMSGDDDEPAAVVAEDARDETTDGDAAQGEGLGLTAICIEGAEDCVDTIDVPYGDFGELPAKCAAEAVDCVEPECAAVTVTDAAPPDELVDPVPADQTAEEELEADIQAREAAAEREAAAPQPAECINPLPICEDPTMSACIPRDCLLMADGSVVCGGNPPPDCAVSSDGSVSCPDPAPIDCGPIEPDAADEFTTLPCVVEPCVPGPAVDCALVDPCVPGPATDCGVIDCPSGIDPAVDVPAGAPPPCIEPGISTDPGAAGGGADGDPGSTGTDASPIE